MKKLSLLLWLMLFILKTTTAQLTFDLQINLQPDSDPRQWSDQPGLLVATTMNLSGQATDFKYQASLLLNGEKIIDTNLSKMPVESIGSGETEIREAQDLVPSAAINFYGNVKETYLRTNQIPAGTYLLCVQIVSPNGDQALSAEVCRPMFITTYQQPSLIFPTSATPISAQVRPMFSWSPVVPHPTNFSVTYRIRVVEVPESERIRSSNIIQTCIADYKAADGVELFYREDREITGVWKLKLDDNAQSPNETKMVSRSSNQPSTEALQAFNYGFPMIDEEVTGLTQFLWPSDLLEPLPGRSYIWSIQALRDDNGQAIGDNNGLAQPAEFFVMEVEGAGSNSENTLKAPDFVFADANGCLYGCTGNVWEPIDCPEGRFSNQDTYPKSFSLAGNCSSDSSSEKKWAIVEDSQSKSAPNSESMLPMSRFVLANPIMDSSRDDTPEAEPSIRKLICWVDENPDGMFPIIRCFDFCPLPYDKNCMQPMRNMIMPDMEDKDGFAALGTQIKVEIRANPKYAGDKKVKQPDVSPELIQTFLGNQTSFKVPFFASLGTNGTLTKINSIAECTEDYIMEIKERTAWADSEIGSEQLGLWYCTLTNGYHVNCYCLPFYAGEVIGGPPGWWAGDCNRYAMSKNNSAIGIRMQDGSSICINIDGSAGPCGSLPSKEEIEKAINQGVAMTPNLTIKTNNEKNSISDDFYLADIYTDSAFVKFSVISNQNTRIKTETIYKSNDSRYQDWSIIFNPENTTVEQWRIEKPHGSRIAVEYCVTVECCTTTNNCTTVHCYSNCTGGECCKSYWTYLDLLIANNISKGVKNVIISNKVGKVIKY